MKRFIAEHPIWFAIIISVADLMLVFLIDLSAAIGLPEVALPIVGSLVTLLLPLGLIWSLGWRRESGFATRTQNNHVLWLPDIAMLVPIFVFGAVPLENRIVIFFFVAMFLTAVGEEALSRGLLLRVMLPSGKWAAVLVPAFLFAIGHITQFLFQGMPLSANVLQITHNFFFGIMYGAARLRVGSLWALIIIHTLNNMFFILGGITGPSAVNEPPVAVLAGLWIVELVYALVILRKPVVVSVIAEASSIRTCSVPAGEAVRIFFSDFTTGGSVFIHAPATTNAIS